VQLISSDGGQLLCDGRPFRFVHVNAYYLQDEVGQGSPHHAAAALDACVALGVPVVRSWAFNDAPWKMSRIQDGLDGPREEGLRALDWVLAEAAQRNLRLILALLDYWPSYGGIAQWLRWRGMTIGDEDARHPERYAPTFYADGQLRDAYRRHVKTLLTRKNTITGVVYCEDPTVLAWELMNEARQAPSDWIAFAADSVRSHARQLVGLGDEGACDSPDLDLASLHFYPEKHGALEGDELRFGLAAMTAALHRVTRPLIVGEFGLQDNRLPAATRRACYADWFSWAVAEGVSGMGPWLLGHEGRRPEDDEHFTFFRGGDYDDVIRVAAASFSPFSTKNC
jgi:mannan endo-1,4-beta-mannosidase